MFQDLVERANLKGEEVKLKKARREEVEYLFRDTVAAVVPEIEKLGFHKVTFSSYKTISSFSLRIQPNSSYSDSRFTYNLQLGSTQQCILYGHGANSASGNSKMWYEYEWSNSKLVITMNNAIRALVAEALRSKAINEARGHK